MFESTFVVPRSVNHGPGHRVRILCLAQRRRYFITPFAGAQGGYEKKLKKIRPCEIRGKGAKLGAGRHKASDREGAKPAAADRHLGRDLRDLRDLREGAWGGASHKE